MPGPNSIFLDEISLLLVWTAVGVYVLAFIAYAIDLARRSERQARVVECRTFAGLTIEETAEALGVSPTTVRVDWRLARAWLGAVLG